MALAHELHQAVAPAQHAFNAENVVWRVAPAVAKGHASDWHQLNNVNAEVSQVIQLFDRTVKGARCSSIGAVEGADMQFINDLILARRHGKISIVLPIEVIVDNHRKSLVAASDSPSARVVLLEQLAVGRLDNVFVLVARLDIAD